MVFALLRLPINECLECQFTRCLDEFPFFHLIQIAHCDGFAQNKTNSNFTTREQLSKYRVQASIGTHITFGKKNTVPSKDSEELTGELQHLQTVLAASRCKVAGKFQSYK